MLRQTGCHFAKHIFKHNFLNENNVILIIFFLLKFVTKPMYVKYAWHAAIFCQLNIVFYQEMYAMTGICQ